MKSLHAVEPLVRTLRRNGTASVSLALGVLLAAACGGGGDGAPNALSGSNNDSHTGNTDPGGGSGGSGAGRSASGGSGGSGGSTGGGGVSGGGGAGGSGGSAGASGGNDAGSETQVDASSGGSSGGTEAGSGGGVDSSVHAEAGGGTHPVDASKADTSAKPDTGSGTTTGGTVILSDSFSGTDNESISGMKPDGANLPGSSWSVDYVNNAGAFDAFIDTGAGNPAPSMHLYDVGSSTGSAAISIRSAGSYTKPAQFSLQVDIHELALGIVILVGFYDSLPASGAATVTGFTGLGYHTDTGDLDLLESGVKKTTINFTGSFNSGAFNTLSYSIDTTTGSISNVKLSGATGSFDFTSTSFTAAATSYVVFGSETGGASGACTYIDNLVIKAE